MQQDPLVIDVVSDVMCPWCYIGKRRLEKALRNLRGHIPFEVHWRPYQLDPGLSKEGVDRKQYLEQKFGSPAAAEKAYRAVQKAGVQEGIKFDFPSIKVSANTLDAHRLIRWAGSQGSDTQARMVGILFRLYFEDGQNIGDDEVLMQAAAEAGLDMAIVGSLLSGSADRAEVSREIETARQMGVTGVPCFILDRKYALVGAQSAETLEQAARQAYDDRQKEDSPVSAAS